MSTFRVIVQFSAATPSAEPEHATPAFTKMENEDHNDDDDGAGAFDPNAAQDKEDDEPDPPCKWKEHQFWLYVDEQLMDVPKLTMQHVRDKKEQESNITKYIFYYPCDNGLYSYRFFTTCLQEDWKKYLSGSKSGSGGSMLSLPLWQLAIQGKTTW